MRPTQPSKQNPKTVRLQERGATAKGRPDKSYMTIRDHKNPPTFLLSIKLLGSTGHIPVGCAVPRSHYGPKI
ncbi:hypothetical protein CBS63078_7576 [Aspergillus niger]|nr:hypothetical protein CBS63078_7576 [Aspergillus niger]KAI2903436.1 hypothetical protein CBS13152_1166 [Aspergillus niger]KAI2962127.1 hypothetical protein CBS147323_7484 [Aspergillus niger]KAI3031350.1 hypothetical protein CBS147347_2104 [Aspergillus niger]KAI3036031.1 hypothetical protein CBS147345_245 [Aspergillus niger]